MTIKQVWKPHALEDREHIFNYVAKANPHAAIELDEEFDAAAERIFLRPDMYVAGRVAGTRECIVHMHFRMVYCITETEIQIVRLVHTAQHWP
ncbi:MULTISPECIES: type II toxin-antitoxin system RelE/ParE family toxin [Rahnella]|uniref:Type II toxin-antitoxin system RelE/ParE family toxin n=1 Tax=Rahnella laticis TaxID=2787622 RepID=A0ABS0E6Z5_9GAMM|nr:MULTISPECIES: type II toxin-antitoxin system RelE/ParE family toxin [Rahnella]MBF7980821.1 type II toxin-antitoxin system RelE/ParE family toxin [Rahnella laticis]MBF8000912.1 type II toxin-antitoxin system RelE/ParE family toxin [Rahnella sp. LAC-M12]